MDFIAYQYNDSGVYVGEVDCQRCPKNNIPLIPKNATKIKPPDIAENQNAVFMEHLQEWSLVYKEIEAPIDYIEEAISLLKNPTKENVKQTINILVNLL